MLESYESEKLRYVLKLVRKFGANLYNYNGINYTKSRFIDESAKSNDGITKSAFLCHKSSLPLFKITAIFRASNVI